MEQIRAAMNKCTWRLSTKFEFLKNIKLECFTARPGPAFAVYLLFYENSVH